MNDDIAAALDAPITYENGTGTLRTYLQDLLLTLWDEEQGFSGKRPFGNSGWQVDVYGALVKAGLITGVIDEYGYVEDYDRLAAEAIVIGAIQRLQ